MKNWLIIFFCFVVALVLYRLMVRYDINIVVNRHIKYLNCDIKYKHEVTNWSGSSLFWAKNKWEEDSARNVLIKCLCEGYPISKDSLSKGYIEDFFSSDSWSQSNYIKLKPLQIDTTVLIDTAMKYFGEIRNVYMQLINIQVIQLFSKRF